jgi:hypothetical protein
MKLSAALSSLVLLLPLVSAASILPRAVTPPPANGVFDYQIGGSYTPPSGVKIVTRDNTENPASGLYNICYINAFQTQPDAKDFWQINHPDLLLKKSNGQYFQDPDWPGEYFLDTSTAAKRTGIAAIMNDLIDDCASKGFNAIEPDNLDTYTRSDGLLTEAGNLALAKLLADHAHSSGLAIGQKNAADLDGKGKSQAGFDFAVVEECQQYKECDRYTDVYGKNIIEIEYQKSNFDAACSARGSSVSVVLRDRDVVPKGQSGYTFSAC